MDVYRLIGKGLLEVVKGVSRKQASEVATQIKWEAANSKSGIIAVVYDNFGQWAYSRPWSVTNIAKG